MSVCGPWLFIFLLFLFCFVGNGNGQRPQLTKNRVLPMEATVSSEKYGYLLTTLEFDQDLYVNDAFLCPGQDRDCASTDCVACDWTDSPTDCSNPNCCGPAQNPEYPSSKYVSEWCDSTLPPYSKLDFGVQSEDFTLSEGEYKYFRFFIGEGEYCRSVRLQLSSEYGDFAILVSSLVAFPNQTALSKIEDGQQFLASSFSITNPTNSFAQGFINICPNVNPLYERGTYSVAIKGQYPQNKGSILLHVAEERYPIAPPEDRYRCDDVPADEFTGSTPYGSPSEYGGEFCLEDGVTKDFFSIPNTWWDIVLPVQPGCHEISLAYDGYTSTGTNGPETSLLFHCGQGSELAAGFNLDASIIRGYRSRQSAVYFSLCLDELTYLHCSGFAYDGPGTGKFMWSTSKPIRHKVSETLPAMLTTYHSLNAAGALHPDLNYEGMNSWGIAGFSWLTQPSTDPLVFYPPYPEFSLNFSSNPLQGYLDAGLSETKSNIVNIVDLTVRKNNVVRSQETLLEGGFIFAVGLTNEMGLPVELCNDDDFDSGKCERGAPLVAFRSWTKYMSTRTFSSLNIVESTQCQEDSYFRELDLVQAELEGALDSNSLDFVAQKAYLSDLYNAGFARSACVSTMANVLRQREDNVTRSEKNFCPYEPFSPEWTVDPCCYTRAQSNGCCSPTTLIIEDDLYTDADPIELEGFCRNTGCDDSYFLDIASSLNTLGNPFVGCSAGLGDPEYELDVLIERQMANFVRPCLIEAGFGDDFLGVDCSSDRDCLNLGTSCDRSMRKCHLNSTKETRERYFDCFISTMPPKIEDYIRRNVLLSIESEFPKDSKYFRSSVLKAASQMDCLGTNPLDIEFGERFIADSALFCKGTGLLYPSIPAMEADEDRINTLCPEYKCLGERACRFRSAKQCKSGINPSFQCLDSYQLYIPPSLSSCPTSQTSCNVESQTEQPLEECSGYECVVCYSANPSDPCVVVDGVSTEEDCLQLVGCEMPDGTVRFDLDEDECLATGKCTADCDGQSCRSVDGLDGVCVVEGGAGVGGGECDSWGGQVVGGSCLLPSATSKELCDQAQLEFSEMTEWATCESLDLNTCSNSSAFTDPYRYLRCFVDEFRECQNEQECLSSGTCSDIEVTKKIFPDSSGWFMVSYGACLSSGTTGFFTDAEPSCWTFVGEFQTKFGCEYVGADYATCQFWGSTASFLYPHWTTWITPARTEETCLQKVSGRYGCALPSDYENSYYFWNETDCECLKGTSDYLFSWTPGTWVQGKPRYTTWKEKKLNSKYAWEETISIVRMEEWVRSAEEAWFVYGLKSQLVCETNYVTSSLSTLVCDCVGDGYDGSSCFPSNIETEVGVTGVCASEASILKGPSSFTNFAEDSLSTLCTEASLSLIQRTWFLFPRSPSSVSFQFAESREKGTVINDNGATTGAVVGDGSKISFAQPDRVNHFTTCLLINMEEVSKVKSDYKIKDFAILSPDFSSMTPLGLGGSSGDRKGRIEIREVDLFTYWCAKITREEFERGSGGQITLFPIVRIEDYEDREDDSLSNQTESLLYTLAAFYLLDLLLVIIFVFVMFKNSVMEGKELPNVTYLGLIFGAVCVFRIVFCFVYVDDGFGDVSEYVVFEIPTFLLFTAVIFVTALFMRLSKKNTFDFKKGDKKLTALVIASLVLVWSIFIVVTVVYSEVILEENEESVCPGRVQSSNDQIEEDVRTLSIVYQSIVITLTLIFALVFLNQSRKLFKMTKNSTSSNEIIFRLGVVIVTCFLLRCILFLILLSIDLTSDIYLFITLFLTEVVMILLISLQLNKRFYETVVSVARTGTGTGSRGSLGGSNGSAAKGAPYEYS